MTEYSSQSVVIGRAFANILLTALTTRPAAALIAAGKIRLSSDPSFSPTPANTIADFAANEAAYSGYAAGGIAATLTVGLNVTTDIQGALASAVFEALTAGPFVSGVVHGYWLDDGTNVVLAEAFPSGGTANFGSPGDYLVLNVVIPENLLQAAA